jgi:glycosyltransferase involved in cell wall biosynthesis
MQRISVIIPSYNRASLLESAVDSALAQTYPPSEIIVVDDGSTDETDEVLARCRLKAQSRQISVHVIKQKQGGAAKSRNAGIAASTGDWLAFLDSDDIWLPEKLELQVNALRAFGAQSAACVADATFVNNPGLNKTAFEYAGIADGEDYRLIDGATDRIAYGYHGLYLQSLLVKRQLAVDLEGFDAGFLLSEDSDFFLRLSLKTQILRVKRALVKIDRTPNREIGLLEIAGNELRSFEIQRRLYEKWLDGRLDIGGSSKELIRKRLHEVHSGLASIYLRNGQFHEAKAALRKAMGYYVSAKVFTKWILATVTPGFARTLVVQKRKKDLRQPFL